MGDTLHEGDETFELRLSEPQGALLLADTAVITIAPGQTTAVIIVRVYGDEEEEEDEQFSLRLFNPQGAFLATPSATGTIIDDDGLSLQIWLWWRQAAASRSLVSRTSVAVG